MGIIYVYFSYIRNICGDSDIVRINWVRGFKSMVIGDYVGVICFFWGDCMGDLEWVSFFYFKFREV